MSPRKPTKKELEELRRYLIENGEVICEEAEVASLLQNSAIAVFDKYITDGPGYCGKVLVVVWPACPEAIQSFVWRNGKLEAEGRSES